MKEGISKEERALRVEDVLETITYHLIKQGELLPSQTLTEDDITEPPKDLSSLEKERHVTRMKEFIAHVEVHENPGKPKRVNRNDESRLLEHWRANRKASELEAEKKIHLEEAAFKARALENPWVALKESGKTEFKLNPIDTSKPLSALEALEMCIGTFAFRKLSPKQKAALKSMPAVALDDVDEYIQVSAETGV